MKTRLLAVPGMLLLAATPLRAVTIAIEPASQLVLQGSTLTVGLVASDVGDGVAPSISTFDLDLEFDGAVLSFVDATFGDPVLGDQLDLTGAGAASGVTASPGLVNLFELSLDPASTLDALQAGGFVLATLSFSAQSPGATPLTMSIVSLGDAAGASLEAAALSGAVEVAPVAVIPEPASLMLLLAGLAGGAAVRRGRRRDGRAPSFR